MALRKFEVAVNIAPLSLTYYTRRKHNNICEIGFMYDAATADKYLRERSHIYKIIRDHKLRHVTIFRNELISHAWNVQQIQHHPISTGKLTHDSVTFLKSDSTYAQNFIGDTTHTIVLPYTVYINLGCAFQITNCASNIIIVKNPFSQVAVIVVQPNTTCVVTYVQRENIKPCYRCGIRMSHNMDGPDAIKTSSGECVSQGFASCDGMFRRVYDRILVWAPGQTIKLSSFAQIDYDTFHVSVPMLLRWFLYTLPRDIVYIILHNAFPAFTFRRNSKTTSCN